MDLYRYDETLRDGGFQRIAGIDEAGRGPLAGPVVAAAVVIDPSERIDGLRDSKKVPERERESLFWEVFCSCLDIGVGVVEADVIDRMNILKATQLAMKQAVKDLSVEPDLLLIDAVQLKTLDIRQMSLIKGESRSASIAAASIIAKVVRDRIMEHYDVLYPEYGFSRHKGYPTKDHRKRIVNRGPCPIHRKSFEHVMSLSLPFACGGG
ncbi:MAG TPA: ribonuclease HII [Thermodesulfovibrionales bacterium]|jgi:ribonuclease HII|nr:ribonuclease HII [Thermodesulfovibrionales bacterium]